MEPRSKYEPDYCWRNRSNLNTMSISELFSKLKGTFIKSDFDLVEKTLVSREEMLKEEIEEKKREMELLEERMKFEMLERVTVEFKLERIQEEMNKKVLMKKGNERGDVVVAAKDRLVGDGVASPVDEMGMNEVLKESGNVEKCGIEFESDGDAVKNRVVGDGAAASADAEKTGENVRVLMKAKQGVLDEQSKKDGLGASDMEEPPLKRVRGKRGSSTTASSWREREITRQKEGGQSVWLVQRQPEVDEKEEDENLMDAGRDEEDERVVQVAKINAATFTYPEPEPTEFPGGPSDKGVLSLYASHIARHIFDGQVREVLTVVSHGRKVQKFDTPDEDWFHIKMARTGLAYLSTTGYEFLDPALISAFVERWHEETSSFHLPAGEITVTLDDVSCLLHLPIEGSLLDHNNTLNKDEVAMMMVSLLGAKPFDAKTQVRVTKGAHAKITYLKELFASHVQSVADYTKESNLEEANKFQDFAIRVYLLILVGWTIFADTSKNTVQLTYLKYFKNLEIVDNYAWGAAALTHLYKGLSAATVPKVKIVAGYMTLLQAWIIQHFPSLCGQVENERYIEAQPAANKFLPKKGQNNVEGYRSALDRMLTFDIHWNPYDNHRVTRPFEEISFYSGWIRCGPMIVRYLPERVLRQFGRVQTIPRHPSHSANPLTPRLQISQQYAQYMDWVLTPEERGDLPLHSWNVAPGYMRWYFRISHPYMIPLPPGDPPRPFEMEALIEEDAH
ncbi:protein MAIN-LIKE 1-like [Trifolium pratense]|uniref:protein MAIN-LIKE 1-like n=1 Tax=Trifolium pratense TaxID=57577 RepID=UPI001E693FF5|nr:protein MAIN-LIKE 1-like [Trifolium pratense]